MRQALLVAFVLTACQPAPAIETALPSYRDPAVQIASKADFDAARFAGTWHEVARFPGTRGCSGAQLRFEAAPGGLRQTMQCPKGQVVTNDIAVAPLGRLTDLEGGAGRPIWVLWTDTTYRTAVLVAPDGSGGQILNRTPGLPVDRLRAALEVLDFNGFETDALMFP